MTVISSRRNSTMAVSESEFRQMKKFMSESHFTCTDEWLLACMNWIKENNESVNFEIWKRELSEQWKDANLEEMESLCLPKNLVNQKLAKLNGKYGLQINSLRDIGESAYSQWNKHKKLENENTSVAATDTTECKQTWEPTPKRFLELTMTDGSQRVFGLEMQPIPGLKINLNNLKPGFKVIIHGPVDCRRGFIHLKPNNIRIIGGEVEDLVESNSVEKILAGTLNLATTQISQKPNDAGKSRTAVITSSSSSTITSNSREKEDIIGDFPDSEDPFADVGVDDDIFMEIDEEALLRSTSRNDQSVLQSVNAPARSTSQMTTQLIDDDYLTQNSSPDESLLRIVDETLESKLLESESSSDKPSSSKDVSNKINPPKTYPVKVSESPYVYLAQIKLEIVELIKKRKVVHVKACVSTVVSNIQVDNGSWTLCVCINDGTDFLNCKISADILTSIIGYTPAEMKQIKATKTKEAKQQISQGMNNLAKELVHLNAIFAIEIAEQPMITEIIDVKLNHSAALKSRLYKL